MQSHCVIPCGWEQENENNVSYMCISSPLFILYFVHPLFPSLSLFLYISLSLPLHLPLSSLSPLLPLSLSPVIK